jgi:hypothetical protein
LLDHGSLHPFGFHGTVLQQQIWCHDCQQHQKLNQIWWPNEKISSPTMQPKKWHYDMACPRWAIKRWHGIRISFLIHLGSMEKYSSNRYDGMTANSIRFDSDLVVEWENFLPLQPNK